MRNLTPTQPKSLLLCLAVVLLPIAAQAQTPIELTSIASATNGARVAWTDPGPGQAYAVQVRESLTSGAWRDGAMRYRWPWPFAHWADAPRNLPAAKYYRVLALDRPARRDRKSCLSTAGPVMVVSGHTVQQLDEKAHSCFRSRLRWARIEHHALGGVRPGADRPPAEPGGAGDA